MSARAFNIERDGIPLRDAPCRLLPAHVQTAIVLAHALAANVFGTLDKKERRSVLLEVGNPKLVENENPSLGPHAREIDNFLRLADLVRSEWLLERLRQCDIEAYGETSENSLDGLKKIPSIAWEWRGNGSPELDFRHGWAIHPLWKPSLVRSVMLVARRELVDPTVLDRASGTVDDQIASRTVGGRPTNRDVMYRAVNELVSVRAFDPSSPPVALRLAEMVAAHCGRKLGDKGWSEKTVIDHVGDRLREITRRENPQN